MYPLSRFPTVAVGSSSALGRPRWVGRNPTTTKSMVGILLGLTPGCVVVDGFSVSVLPPSLCPLGFLTWRPERPSLWTPFIRPAWLRGASTSQGTIREAPISGPAARRLFRSSRAVSSDSSGLAPLPSPYLWDSPGVGITAELCAHGAIN